MSNPHSPARCLQVTHQKQAIALRRQGKTYEEIAGQLGCHVNTARAWVKKAHEDAKADLREDVVEYVELQMSRLDDLLAQHLPAAMTGCRKALDAVLRIMDKQDKLMGAEKVPQGTLPAEGHLHFHGMTNEEIATRARQMGLTIPTGLLPPPTEGRPPLHDSRPTIVPVVEAEVVVEGRPPDSVYGSGVETVECVMEETVNRPVAGVDYPAFPAQESP